MRETQDHQKVGLIEVHYEIDYRIPLKDSNGLGNRGLTGFTRSVDVAKKQIAAIVKADRKKDWTDIRIYVGEWVEDVYEDYDGEPIYDAIVENRSAVFGYVNDDGSLHFGKEEAP